MKLHPSKEVIKATCAGVIATLVLLLAIVVGSRNLAHFDAALVGYTFATLAATFGIAYRYGMWLQRPPTALYWDKTWKLFFWPPHRIPYHAVYLAGQLLSRIGFNVFILKRSFIRGGAHLFIMWGCLIAAAITFPLVFGWLYFITPPNQPDVYQIVMFGFPTATFHIESLMAELTFHGLVIASVLVTIGVMIAMRRRMRDRDAAVLQSFEEDFLPLLMLFSISITGLLLTVSYTWLQGYGYDFLAVFHAATVILTLIWLPFGKFFHIFQRPAQLGVDLYKHIGAKGESFPCKRCGQPFASAMHVRDLIEVETRLGYRYQMTESLHYQEVCPQCRRQMLGISQGKLWQGRYWTEAETTF